MFSEGELNIALFITFSIVPRSPRAPSLNSIVLSTIYSRASSVNVSLILSNSKIRWYCFINAFFGSFNILSNASLSSSLVCVMTGKRPMISGINPNFFKSIGLSFFIESSSVVFILTSILYPMTCLLHLALTILSNPTNAPPHMNNIFFVLIFTRGVSGCLRPPLGGIDTIDPSRSFNNACCTPSPDTSRVIDALSPFLVILSISSMNTIPRSVLSTS